MCREQCTKAGSKRWSIHVFYSFLDITEISAWALYSIIKRKNIRKVFILQLPKELRRRGKKNMKRKRPLRRFSSSLHRPSLAMTRTAVTSVFMYLVVQSVVGYENAYDLLERINQRIYEPRKFQARTFYDGRNHFYNQNRNPRFGYAAIKPHFSQFGNGYDNLGNGVPAKHFHPFRQQLTGSWRFGRRSSQGRNFNDYYFEDYPTLRRFQHDYDNYLWRGHHPSTHSYAPAPNEINEDRFGSRGKADFIKVDRYTEDNEDKNHKQTDELYQRNQKGVNVDFSKNEKKGEQLHADQTGENKSSLRSNKVVKKGRTTKGFAIHHHKDETGNSTTFFDETSDFGGQSDLRDIADGFSTRRTSEQTIHEGDEKHFEENEAQTGNYGSGLLVGNQKYEKDFSTSSGHDESENKFRTGNEEDDFGLKKTYQYLNGDKFEYREPHADNYY